MKISVNWMQKYAKDVKILPKGGIDELVEKIGAQLGAVEGVWLSGAKYDGVVVAKVVSCEKHPNADKLSVCKIDDGGKTKDVKRDKDGLVQVVCGAPNARKGLTVAWIKPGGIVPSSYWSDQFVLESREIRGEISNGMLGSPAELAISDNHDGILEIDEPKARAGQLFKELYDLDDVTIEIENKMFTHRPDCFGMLGVAREIAGITHQQFSSPQKYLAPKPVKGSSSLKLTVKNKVPKLVPRFMTQMFENVTVEPSPIWMQTYLNRVGVRPINNIVDITNYFMLLTGQPMHAYDYDKLPVKSLETRLSKKGDKLKLLNGKELTLEDSATILITSGDKAVGVGGVMGGADTEVEASTKNIVLECANFDMYAIRRTAMQYGLFTDAVTRFNKGQSALQCTSVLAWAAEELVNGGATAGGILDEHGSLKVQSMVRVSAEFINQRLGLKLGADDMQMLLEHVEFKVERTDNKDELKITPPFWRTDIEIPEDIVEEVGRLYGYDHLPLDLPVRDLTPAGHDPLLSFKQRVREILAKAGANELLTYSFVHGNLLDKVGQDRKMAFELSNALSPDLQYYRLSLTPSLLDKVHGNIKAGYDEFALFELGKGHNKGQMEKDNKTLPAEFEMLALTFAGSDKKQSEFTGAPYFTARKYLDYLADELGVNLNYKPIEKAEDYQVSKPFDHKRSSSVWCGDTPLGMVGEYRASVVKALKLPHLAAGFEISVEQLMASAQGQQSYQSIPRFPKVQQDISLKVSADLPFVDLLSFVQQNLQAPDETQLNWTPIDIYQGADKKHKNITLRLTIASHEKTMTDTEVNSLLDAAAAKAKTKFGAERL